MKKALLLVFVLSTLFGISSCKYNESLPLPSIEEGIRGDLGIDANINEKTIDKYLNRDDCVYIDVRMLDDDANFEAIGGDSHLSGFISGFEVVPYPYLCEVEELPIEVGEPYDGPTLFTHLDNEYIGNYRESLNILEGLFPKDKNIILMCGGGGYAGMTKKLLVGLGWDENKIYNAGGYWYYEGKNKIGIKYEENGEIKYDYSLLKYHDIDFSNLTRIYDSSNTDIDNKIEKTDFIKISTLEELQNLEDNKETFPLFVFLSGCHSCAEFLPIVQKYVENNSIKMYSIDLNDIWGTSNSITDRIKYAPSLFLYRNGEVIAYLDSSKDSDYEYYKSVSKLDEWINTHIDTNELKEDL